MSIIIILLILNLNLCLSLKCYECTGYVPCGNGQTHLLVNCPGKCMIYKNQFDGDVIIRRCCWSNCGNDGTAIYEGRFTYFCSEDMCNGQIGDNNLIQGVTEEEGSGEELLTSPTTTSSTSTSTRLSSSTRLSPIASTVSLSIGSSSMSCHECTGHYSSCGTSQYTIIHNCRMCMVYLNQYDGNTVVRRCCYWNCGPSNSVNEYEGRQTYFCSSNLCNGIGSENILTGTRGQFIADDSFPNN